jgi:hypothetical protein
MADPTRKVVAFGPRSGRRRQDARQAVVRASLVEARAWIVAGLEGAVSLEEATASAVVALSPAHREVLRSALP